MTYRKALLDDEKKLRKYFEKNIKLGKILKSKHLTQYAKNRKLNVSPKFIRNIRNYVLPTLLYKQPINIKTYQTITVDRLGLLSMDFCYYPPPIKKKYRNWKRFNDGHVGFLVINSVAAKKWVAMPMKSRTMKEFEKVLTQVFKGNYFPAINKILSDREVAIASPNFKKKIFEKYGVKFHFLTRYSKAWPSESAIHWVKEDLSQALVNNGKRWLELLQEVVNTHNKEKIDGTDFSPNEINTENFYEYLNQLNESKDFTMSFNTNSIDSRSILNQDWIKKLFKYYVNERVFASNYALKGRKVFGKQSVEGTFSKTPYIIKRAKLRHTKKNTLVPGV